MNDNSNVGTGETGARSTDDTDRFYHPPDEHKREVEKVLVDGPLTHDEVLERVDMTEEEMKRARTVLWREGKVKHTLDRRFDLYSTDTDR